MSQFYRFQYNGQYNSIKDSIPASSIVFVSESGKESLHTQGDDYNFIPSNGTNGQVLVSENGIGVWKDIDVTNMLAYGVEWKPDVADPALTRVGNMTYHKTLPIQSEMKGCILNPKTKKVVYWLDEDDWKYKKGGNPNKGEVEDLARLDGYDGEVFVHIPEFYIKSWDEPNRRCVMISPTKIDDTWEHQPSIFMGAYKDTVLNAVPTNMGYLSTLEVNTAVSIANSSDYCRGGSNDSSNDAYEDIFRRQLGKHRTNISRATFRTYTRKANKEIMSYKQYKNILYWLYVIEYANFNSQAEYNAELTSEGFHQGGLGMGVTTMSNWGEYNGYYPITPNGYTNEFGNGTGVKDLIIPEFTYDSTVVHTQTLKTIRWRGIENPFGDTWNNVDGIIINSSSVDKDGVKYSEVYITDNPVLYSDSDWQSMKKVGEEYNSSNGYIKEFDLGSTAEIIPRSNGGDASQYKCDYHYVNTATGLRTLLLGGSAAYWSLAGLARFGSYYGVGYADADVGFRSVFKM